MSKPRALEIVAPAASDIEQELIHRKWLVDHARSHESRRKYRAALALFLRASGAESVAQACRDYENARRNIERFHRELEHLSASSQRQAISALRTLLVLCEAEELYPKPVSHWLKRRITASKCDVCGGVESEAHICWNCRGTGVQPEALPKMPESVPGHAACLRCIELEPDPGRALLLRCFYFTGARLSELANLRKDHVKAAKSESGKPVLVGFVRSKGRVMRRIVFEGRLRVQMEAWLRSFAPDGDYVFPWRSERNYHYICAKAWKRVGITAENCGSMGRGAHLWRHAHISNAKLLGASRQQIVDGTGHSQRVMADWYLHTVPVTAGGVLQQGL